MQEIVLLGNPDPASVSQRLKQENLKVRLSGSTSVDPLDGGSPARVYCVGWEVLGRAEWPRWRTALAHANRYYVVFGGVLNTREVVQACRDGAYDVVSYDDPLGRWSEALRGAAKAQQTWLQLYGGGVGRTDSVLLGTSESTVGLRRAVDRIGPTQAGVLILGESGVGKEKVAEALHLKGGTGSLVAFNCAAIPTELLESELFGVNKGAFTGAQADKPGLVEQAAGGTLFLDEIGELQLNLQAKLLRFLQTRRARRLGSTQDYEVSLRIIAATNRDLEQEVTAGRFRADLYYRLAEVTLRVPPLRHRPEDIPVLARHFLEIACERFGKYFDMVEPALIQKFQQHTWPGNVRELKSAIDRCVLLHDGPVLRANFWDLPSATQPASAAVPAPGAPAPTGGLPADTLALPSRSARIELARRLLAEGVGDLGQIAARSGIHPTTLFRWRKAGLV